MLTVLLDNFDVLGDTYSLPGVWGPDHRRLVRIASTDLINPTRPVLSLHSCCRHAAAVGFPIAVPNEIAYTACSDPCAAKWPSF